jgi:hypothetical protein
VLVMCEVSLGGVAGVVQARLVEAFQSIHWAVRRAFACTPTQTYLCSAYILKEDEGGRKHAIYSK